jgi:thiol-disulfide isomerase/thioredoxin
MSSFPFSDYPLLVACWYQDGCPACEEYLPRLRGVAERYKACVPTAILDANEYTEDADGVFVRATPTTMILRYGRRSPYTIGAVTDLEIDQFYQVVMRSLAIGGQACELG